MSWAEVYKINEYSRQNTINGALVIENSKTWTAPKTGYYKIIVVGGSGDYRKSSSSSSPNVAGGGAGGVAIKTLKIISGTAYAITIDTTTSSDDLTATSFGTGIVANSGTGGTLSGASGSPTAGVGGTATGGDYNYKGENGATSSGGAIQGASIGCFIPGLTDRQEILLQSGYENDVTTTHLFSGYGILGHGGGVSVGTEYSPNISRQTGCVVIIPLGGI